MESTRARAPLTALITLLAAGALLRLATLDVQSYWIDEAVTVELVHKPLRAMLGELPDSERNPPLHYVALWAWSRAFGTSEVALRLVSAIAGTATVWFVFAAGRHLFHVKAGMWAATLASVSPVLVWYSQEARPYALLTLFVASALWAWARYATDGGARWLMAWAVLSTAGILTHYFAAFLFLPQAVLLVRRPGRARGQVLAACSLPVLAGVALLPLALYQSSHVTEDYISRAGLLNRIESVPKKFLTGENGAPVLNGLLVLAALAALAWAFWALARRRHEREAWSRPAQDCLVMLAFAVVVPLGLALVGQDFFAYRNLLACMVPLLLLAGAGFARLPVRGNPGVLLVLVFAAISVATPLDTGLHRTDWRWAGHLVAQTTAPGYVIVAPGYNRRPLGLYIGPRTAQRAQGPAHAVRFVMVVGFRRSSSKLPRGPDGFRFLARRDHQNLTVLTYAAAAPRGLTPRSARRGVRSKASAVLYLPPVG